MRQIVGWACGWCVVCGSCWWGSARAPGDPPLRGVVRSSGPEIRAVRVGPALIHAYAPITGADLFVVPALTGTVTDCAVGGANRATAAQEIVPDRRSTISVAAGQMACVSVHGSHGVEVLWHAHEELGPPALVGSLSAGALR